MIRSSIRNKLIVFLLAATIIPIFTSIIMTYLYTKQTVSNEAVQSNSNLIRQANKNLLNYLKVIEQSSLSVYNDNTFYTIIENGNSDYLSNNEINRGLQTIANSVKEIRQAYLYVAASKRSLLISERNPTSGSGIPPRYMPAASTAEVLLEPTHLSHDYGMQRLFYTPPSKVITLHRSIRNALTHQQLGSLSIDFDLEVISSICEELYTRGEEELYILDEQGTIIYGANPAIWGQTLDEPWVQQMNRLKEPMGSFESRSKQFAGIHIYERLAAPYTNWTMVKQIPYDSLYKSAKQITMINTLIFSLFLIIVIAATLYISFRITAPIRHLLGYISRIQTGDMQVHIEATSHDEIGVLARRFRLMMQTINHLISSEYKLDIANKTNQLKALQAQINPHFLYNALQSIGTLALQHQAPKVYHLLSALGKMMRYSMNTSESHVQLLQELNHLKAYLLLQLQRFENELTVRYDIEESTLSLDIPKMLLQPLVENYFKHGFDPRKPHNALIVSSHWSADGQHAILAVEDNGRGMSQEELDALLQQLSQTSKLLEREQDSHIGLYNVKSRLLLSYKGKADLHIERIPSGGFKVQLLIPTQKQDFNEKRTDDESHHH